MSPQPKALALISGGLDSLLAAKVVQEQGIHVEGINFYTGFCVEGHTQAIRKPAGQRPKRNNALWVAEQLGIQLHFMDIVEEYKQVLMEPRFGYGAHLNPCLDCKIFMVRKAHEWMLARGFDFLITGEVVGQRPLSQLRASLPLVARESGVQDRLVRPLCAKHLPPTLPERMGWVNRECLLGFHGRSRKPQIALAARYGFTDYAQPAGGCCFLTDPRYAHRLADLWKHRGSRTYELDDIILLKVGRHLRLSPQFKLIVAREEGEGRFLQGYRHRYISLASLSHPGPVTLLDGQASEAELLLSARLVARYGKGRAANTVEMELSVPGDPPRRLHVVPLEEDAISRDWLV